MATSVTPIRRPSPIAEPPFEELRDRLLAIAPGEGHSIITPDLCVYRLSQPTTLHKAATFGVTLGVVLQGAKLVSIDRHELLIDPRRALVVTRETEHDSQVLDATAERPFLGLSLCFEPERVARALLALSEAGAPATREVVPAFVMPFEFELAGALERLLGCLSDPFDRKLLAPLVIEEILYRLLRSDAAAAVRSGVSRAADAQRILEAMRFIRERHAANLTVPQIARQAAMSPSHFAHRFRAVARISPMRYLREVRLERARELLLREDARAGEVATQVGFESPAHFAREFKRRFGAPPSHFRGVRGDTGR